MEMTKTNTHIREMVYVALFAALIAICSWISIPTTVPITLQTLGICVAAGLLGKKLGTLSVLVYVLLGAVGLPVFAGFSGGLGVLLGTTGGYVLGFLFTALATGLVTERLGRSTPVMALGMVLGVVLCYFFGTVWFMVVYANTSGPVGVFTALSWCVFPFVVPDLCKIALAILLVRRLERAISI